jgi:ABC-2 type transport system permease protein
VVAALTVAIAGLLAGAVLFPIGSLTTLSGTTLPLVDGTLRILVAAVIVGGSLVGLAAIGMFVSTATDAPVGAMAATAGVAVLSGVLDAIPQLHALHPWLLTHWWLTFGDLFRAPVVWTGILKNAGVQAIYGVIFATAAWARFSNKDVLA